MTQSITNLEWDSNFFNFNVGKIESNCINNSSDIEAIEQQIRDDKIELLYYSSQNELPQSIQKNTTLDIILVDRKTTYSKSINSKLIVDKKVISADPNTNSHVLNKLAIQSGIYSRFNIDKRIGQKKFEEMYSLWMQNSLNRQIAKEVLIYQKDNTIAGFVTLGEKNGLADIGIIAVDEAFRGLGIGKTLMQSAEKWFSNENYQSIQVVTQGNNIPACKLYASCKYNVKQEECFYHIWRNKKEVHSSKTN